jgi:hypothetical protein
MAIVKDSKRAQRKSENRVEKINPGIPRTNSIPTTGTKLPKAPKTKKGE